MTCICNHHPNGSGIALCHGFIRLVDDNKTVNGPVPINQIFAYKFEDKYDFYYYKVGDKVGYMIQKNTVENLNEQRMNALKHIMIYNPNLKVFK